MAAAAPCPVRTVSGFDPLSLSPRLLRCFVAVAEELHFGRAADRLYVAQPALSRSIQQLERMLDRPLFIRTTRSVALTSSATRLLPAAREILESLDQAAGDLALDRHALRVAHVAGYDTAALVLDQLVRGAPDVAVQEFAMSAAEQLRGVRDGELDVAVCPVRESLDRSLRGAIVRYDPLLVAMLGRHAESGRPVDPRHRTVCACDAGTEDADAAFLDEFEAASGCRLRRIPVAADSGTEAYALRRSGALAFVTPASRGIRLDSARALVGTVPLQAYQPWAIVWRRHDRSHLITSFLAAARQVAVARRWLDLDALPGDSWLPATTPIAALITERNRSEPEWPLAA